MDTRGEIRNSKSTGVRWLHVGVVILYCVLHFVIGHYHEPWFDEAQAWQIAKCASIKEILFKIPHYEGHPPLWHLILAVPAKLGVPYELSLQVISILFSGTAVMLLLKYAPFKEWIKTLLPFTYFMFYQYSIIARPYCMMMLAIVLVAITWGNRQEKTKLFIAGLVFLCMTSAYGIAIAGGISAAWLVEIVYKRPVKKWLKSRQIRWLCGLFVFACVLMVQIVPIENVVAFADHDVDAHVIILKAIYLLLAIMPDTLFTTVIGEDIGLNYITYEAEAWIPAVLLGILLWGLILYYGYQTKTLIWFLGPYIMFALSGITIYISVHHIGIMLFIILFWLWIYKDRCRENGKIKCTVKKYEKIMSRVACYMLAASIFVPLFWNISACMLDIKEQYYPSEKTAMFIKENNLDEYRIMAEWRENYDKDGTFLSYDTNYTGSAVAMLPYFDHNILYTLNNGNDLLAYDTHKVADDTENAANIKSWREKGLPDILYGTPELSRVYNGEECNYADYRVVYKMKSGIIWKNLQVQDYIRIYVRKELADKLSLHVCE